MRGRLREDSGLIAVMVAVFSVVMFVLAALVVDLGLARETSREAQTAADAAALAGAGELYADDGTLRASEAIAAVKDYVGENYGTSDSDWSSCTVPLDGGWSSSADRVSSGTSCIAFRDSPSDPDVQPNEIRVVVPAKHTAALFGSLLGYTGSDIGAQAEASAVSSAIPPCALCVLGVLKTGSANVRVSGGGSMHAGSGGDLSTSGSVTVVDAGTISFTGAANPPTGPKYSPNPPVTNSGVPVNDRYQGATMPAMAGLPDSGSDSVDCGSGDVPSLTPGRYRDITIKNLTCDLAPGLYVITGTLQMQSANSRVAGSGVTLYFACGTRQSPSGCGSGSPGGWLDGSREGMSLGSAFFGGFSLLYDPGNTSPLVLTVAGDSVSQSFGGAIYAKSAGVLVDRGQVSVNGPMVVGSLELRDSATHLAVHAPGLATVPGAPEILLTK